MGFHGVACRLAAAQWGEAAWWGGTQQRPARHRLLEEEERPAVTEGARGRHSLERNLPCSRAQVRRTCSLRVLPTVSLADPVRMPRVGMQHARQGMRAHVSSGPPPRCGCVRMRWLQASAMNTAGDLGHQVALLAIDTPTKLHHTAIYAGKRALQVTPQVRRRVAGGGQRRRRLSW